MGCHGTLTAGLAAPSTGERWSALDLALACGPEAVNGGGVTVASDGGEARDEKLEWAGVKADDGDGMDVTLEVDTAPNGLGALLKATLAVDENLGATADVMGTGLTSSLGSTYVKQKQQYTKKPHTHTNGMQNITVICSNFIMKHG